MSRSVCLAKVWGVKIFHIKLACALLHESLCRAWHSARRSGLTQEKALQSPAEDIKAQSIEESKVGLFTFLLVTEEPAVRDRFTNGSMRSGAGCVT